MFSSSPQDWLAAPLPCRSESALAAVRCALTRHPDSGAEAAADWMMNFIPEDQRAAAVADLVSVWAGENFTAPEEWLRKNQAAPWRNAGLAALCRGMASADPGSAAVLASGITDETLRAEVETLLKRSF